MHQIRLPCRCPPKRRKTLFRLPRQLTDASDEANSVFPQEHKRRVHRRIPYRQTRLLPHSVADCWMCTWQQHTDLRLFSELTRSHHRRSFYKSARRRPWPAAPFQYFALTWCWVRRHISAGWWRHARYDLKGRQRYDSVVPRADGEVQFVSRKGSHCCGTV